MKNLIYRVFILLLSIVTTLSSCNKSDAVAITSFDKILQGTWAFDSLYTINGQSFVFSDLEKKTELIFLEENYTISTPDKSFGHGYYLEDDQTDVLTSEDIVSFNSACSINNYNTMKLVNSDGFHYNRNYNGVSYIKNYMDEFPNIVKIFSYHRPSFGYYLGGYEEDLNKSNKEFLQSWGFGKLYFDSKYTSTSTLKNVAISDFDYFGFDWTGYSGGGSQVYWRAKIKELTSSSLKLSIICNFYGRTASTYTVLDKVEVSLKKKPTKSGTIIISPFDITKYTKNFWEKCETVSSSYLSSSSFKNGASITSGGVDNNCLSLPNASSYAEFQKLLKKNTTLSFWVKPDDVTKAKQYIATKYKNQYGPYILSLEADKFTIELNNGSGVLQKVQSTKSITKGVWNHICLSIDNNNAGVLYINGVKDSSGALNSVDYDADSKALLGTTEQAVLAGQTSNNYKGSIDEIIQFGSILTEGEVYQLYKWHLTN